MQLRHSWPCNPYDRGCGPMEPIAEVPWLELKRCGGCGLLWEFRNPGAFRVSLEHVSTIYPDAPPLPSVTMRATEPARLLAVSAEYRSDELFQLRISTSTDTWSMADRGSLIPERFAVHKLVPLTVKPALKLVSENWGEDAAAALRFAIATGFEDTALHALDVVQGFAPTAWEQTWQPGTAALVDAMLDSRPSDRMRVAAEIGLQRGIPAEDLRVAGLLLKD